MTTMDSREITGRTVDGRYRIVRRIARGGMATVYEAHDERLERNVALKVMHPQFSENPEFVARFVGEARAAARLSHPNVVAMHDQGTDGDDVYLVMELVTGCTLRDVLVARGRLAPTEALDVLEPILDALGAAHRAGLVHRDVKPENVLITPDGRVKVADFGLARAASTVTNATQGVLIGTVAYLSPEQVDRGTADVRSDVYGAGIVLFEMLVGRPPFTGESPIAIAYKHVNEAVPAPTSVSPSIPLALDTLVAGATDRDPDRRYRDADGFASAARATRDRLGLVPAGPAPFVAPSVVTTETIVVASDLATDAPDVRRTGVLSTAAADQVGSAASAAPSPTDDRTVAARTRSRWRGPLALLLVLALALGAGAVAWSLGTTPQIAVPGVLGTTTKAAQNSLTSVGLTGTVGGSVFSETVPSGRIIRSQPAPGELVDEGSSVTLTVSKGPERFAVPNVAGQTSADARKAIERTKLDVGRTSSAFSSTVAAGTVISSDPKAGAKVKRETVVDLVISKGPQPISVPTVKGKTVEQARSAITGAGLTASVTEKFSESVPEGRVISQSPSSGTLPPRGTVALVVSKGPAPVPVPNVVNKKLNSARKILQDAGFVVQVRNDIPGGPGIVLQQSPSAGTARPKGSTISLDVFRAVSA